MERTSLDFESEKAVAGKRNDPGKRHDPDFSQERLAGCSSICKVEPGKSDDLPQLDLHEKMEPANKSDVRQMLYGVVWLLERDDRFGAPKEANGQVSKENGLLTSIEFPNNKSLLQVNYDDYRSGGQIGSIRLGDKAVQFSYSDGLLDQISFSGPSMKEPIQFHPYDQDFDVASMGNKQVKCDNAQFARLICNFLRS